MKKSLFPIVSIVTVGLMLLGGCKSPSGTGMYNHPGWIANSSENATPVSGSVTDGNATTSGNTAKNSAHQYPYYLNSKFEGVLFYNLENLFDTIDGPNDDAEFLPQAENRWNTERYKNKLTNMATVLDSIQNRMGYCDLARTKNFPVNVPVGVPRLSLMGFVELENEGVLKDLFETWKVIEKKERQNPQFFYKIVHRESPDKRGIDVAIAFDSTVWRLVKVDMIPVPLPGNYPTRDIMAAHLIHVLTADTFVVAVNHWPSRRGGAESAPNRAVAAKALRQYLLTPATPQKMIVMGDFNDDPADPSLLAELGAQGLPSAQDLKALALNPSSSHSSGLNLPLLLNPAKTYRDSFWLKGSLAYRPYSKPGQPLAPVQWNQFDQIMISPALLKQSFLKHNALNGAMADLKTSQLLPMPDALAHSATLDLYKKPVEFGVYAPSWLRQHEEPYMDFPLRTFGGKKYLNGYSDHFPVYLLLNF